MKEKFYRFMIGRYGTDALSKFMMGVAVAVMLVNLFIRSEILNIVVAGILVLVYMRVFSTNIQKRYNENVKYLTYQNRVTGYFLKQKRMLEDRRVNHIYRCPGCGQKIRIPRGKGRIMITCPKCRREFQKKS